MGAAVAAIGVLIGIVGAAGVASPKLLLTALDQLKSSRRKIYGLAVARLLIGVILVLGAPSTTSPTVVLFIGAVFVLRAAMIPLLGVDRIRSLIEWSQSRSSLGMRLALLGATAFGVFLVWVATKH